MRLNPVEATIPIAMKEQETELAEGKQELTRGTLDVDPWCKIQARQLYPVIPRPCLRHFSKYQRRVRKFSLLLEVDSAVHIHRKAFHCCNSNHLLRDYPTGGARSSGMENRFHALPLRIHRFHRGILGILKHRNDARTRSELRPAVESLIPRIFQLDHRSSAQWIYPSVCNQRPARLVHQPS
uniref:(northern house mosquito) hypothetical protein n=1 Tax=Culex pipiens TaxID=7175 RepID=A0A8D8L471_CULPI